MSNDVQTARRQLRNGIRMAREGPRAETIRESTVYAAACSDKNASQRPTIIAPGIGRGLTVAAVETVAIGSTMLREGIRSGILDAADIAKMKGSGTSDTEAANYEPEYNPEDAMRSALHTMSFQEEISNRKSFAIILDAKGNGGRETYVDPQALVVLLESLPKGTNVSFVVGNRSAILSTITGMFDIFTGKFAALEMVVSNEAEHVGVRIPNPRYIGNLHISKTVMDAEYVISISKLQTDAVGGIALSAWNLLNAVPGNFRRSLLASRPESIADLVAAIRPNAGFIEGVEANQGTAVLPDPVRSGVVLGVLNDLPALDIVGASLMKRNSQTSYLRYLPLHSALRIDKMDEVMQELHARTFDSPKSRAGIRDHFITAASSMYRFIQN